MASIAGESPQKVEMQMTEMNGHTTTDDETPVRAIDRLAALQEQIEELKEVAIGEIHAKIARHASELKAAQTQLAELSGATATKSKRRRASKVTSTGDVDDTRSIAERIKAALRHSREAMRSEQIADSIGVEGKSVSAELRKMRIANEVEVVSGAKRSTAWGLVAS